MDILEQQLLDRYRIVNQLLESKILEYRVVIGKLNLDTLDAALVLNTYDEHFAIKIDRQGKI